MQDADMQDARNMDDVCHIIRITNDYVRISSAVPDEIRTAGNTIIPSARTDQPSGYARCSRSTKNADWLSPPRINERHASSVAKRGLLTMLHNAIETLLIVCDRRVSERVESVINTINKDANAHKVTWRIQPCGIERPNVDAHDVGVL